MMNYPRPGSRWLRAILLAPAVALLFPGCSSKHFRENADREVYKIIAHKRKAALGEDKPFTIDQAPWDPLDGLPRRAQPIVPEVAEAATSESDAPAIMSLSRALQIALRNSRDYQRRKENVYISALGLTKERDAYRPTLTAALSGDYKKVAKDEIWVADTSFGISQAFATGAEMTLTLTSDFLRYSTRAPRAEATSSLVFRLVQPLWRGAGQRIAQENLTQAERDVVYELRSMARFHKTFAVSVVSSYYNILLQRARVRNEWNNYQRLVLSRERSAKMAEAGRLDEFQVDQARQDELRARDNFIRAQQSYTQRLDSFKLTLALPMDARIDVDENDLDSLLAGGIVHPQYTLEEITKRALALRLDLMTARDKVADAQRKVDVAKNGLGPDVNLVVTAAADTEDDTKPTRFRFDKGAYTAGLDIDLPLERTSERNTYRQTLISLDRTQRAASELEDQIKQQTRQAWRSLREAKESYEIQRRSLALAERRVDSTTLLLKAGRASTRDLLESQRALLTAQNSLISVIVDHTVAKLELWRDIGTLSVAPEGQLKGKMP